MVFCFREFKKKDSKKVSELIKALYREYPTDIPISSKKINKTFKEILKDKRTGLIFVIAFNKKVIGYAILVSYWSNEFGGRLLEIDELYVEKNYRGKRIGKKFMDYIKKTKPNNSIGLQIEVSRYNRKAKKFYNRLGFEYSQNQLMVFQFKK